MVRIPEKILEVVYMAYTWGYKDKTLDLEPKSKEQVKNEIQGGFDRVHKLK